ncbi:CHAT domain-containing protein [Microcoleus sp. herbarium12]|uniref:CHAT domain-containing protein n=1 Tax=Microcoleus sp. herbarium12 TaxID=3055437 RepID=UPI002FD449B6
MLVNTVIVEKLEIDGTVKTFTMEADKKADKKYDLWIALADEYEDSREGPFHFLERRYAKRFSREFGECPVRRVGKTNFNRLNDSYEFSTSWQGISTKMNCISYYALSLPEYAVPQEIRITDTMRPDKQYRKTVIRDDQKKCFVIYLECTSCLDSFNFDLFCRFNQEEKVLFEKAEYQENFTADYWMKDVWQHSFESREVVKIENFLERGVFAVNNKVILSFGEGNLNDGFPSILAQIFAETGQLSAQCAGQLPPCSELLEFYREWKLIYEASLGIKRKLQKKPTQITKFSRLDFNNSTKKLEEHLNKWLISEQFIPIDRILHRNFNQSNQLQVIIQSQNPDVRRLPWHLWDFINSYPKAEIALSSPSCERVLKTTVTKNRIRNFSTRKIRILSVLGGDKGINLERDKQLLTQLDAETALIVKPNYQELEERLWSEQGWDILCFSGHSSSEMDGSTGYIYINDTEKLTISYLKNGLKTAIARGLQIAIFNSCDGLGLANQLAELHIPQIIVFRELVPDVVAQEFLKNFLTAFASGKSFYLAVREAREKLEGLENYFPCASWLPIICQNPAEVSPSWYSLQNP